MTSLKNKRAVLILGLMIVLIGFGATWKQAGATSLQNLIGWAWGGSSSIDGAYQGIGWVSFNDTNIGSGGGSYGVNVPFTNGPLSGHAWSEHYGWISFDGTDLSGCNPGLSQATRDGNTITGGARILAIRDDLAVGNSGGYDGCISLSGAGYGVIVTGTPNILLSGYAWSSDLGWLDFTGVSIVPPSPTVTLTANPTYVLSGNPTTLTWTVTGDADSCWASGAWTGWKTFNATNNEVVNPGGTSVYTIECFNLGASSGQKSVTVQVPSVQINANTCTVPVGVDQCTGGVWWQFTDAVAPYSVVNTQTGTTIGTTVNSSGSYVPTLLKFGQNKIDASSNGSLIGFTNANVSCVSGAQFSSLLTSCEIAPSITVTATPNIIRSGKTSTVNVTVTSPNTVTCSLLNADTPTPTITHSGTLANPTGTYSKTTRTLTAAQIVSVSCTDSTTGLISTAEVRIEVVPVIQEI